MKNLIKDERAILNPILDFMLSVLFIIILYILGMPLLTAIINYLINLGGNAEQFEFYLSCARTGFLLFLIAAFIILFAKIWKKTHDTERYDPYRFR